MDVTMYILKIKITNVVDDVILINPPEKFC